jgi:hypothetical protein
VKYLDRPGLFKAKPIDWLLRYTTSGAAIIQVTFECVELHDGESWGPIPPSFVRGDFFPLKKTGAANDVVVEMLCMYLGWGGTFAEVDGAPLQKGLVQVEVEGRDYKNKTYYGVQWIRDENAEPRGGGVSAEDAHNLDREHGKALRAAASKFTKARPASQRTPEPYAGQDNDIPFSLLFALPLLTLMFQ